MREACLWSQAIDMQWVFTARPTAMQTVPLTMFKVLFVIPRLFVLLKLFFHYHISEHFLIKRATTPPD